MHLRKNNIWLVRNCTGWRLLHGNKTTANAQRQQWTLFFPWTHWHSIVPRIRFHWVHCSHLNVSCFDLCFSCWHARTTYILFGLLLPQTPSFCVEDKTIMMLTNVNADKNCSWSNYSIRLRHYISVHIAPRNCRVNCTNETFSAGLLSSRFCEVFFSQW